MSTLLLDGASTEFTNLRVRSFVDDPTLRFVGTKRKVPVTEIIVHETVTRDVQTALRVLRRRKLGAHFIVAPDGDVLQLADPVTTRLEHAAPHNVRSVGIEIVSPVEPRFLRKGLPWTRTLRGAWAPQGHYVLPTLAQAEACAGLLEALTRAHTARLAVSRTWQGLRGTRLAMGRVRGSERRAPGIYAHGYFRHHDGAWPVLYAWLRLEACLGPEEAFERAAELASGNVRHVELGSLLNDRGPKEERWTLKSPRS